MIQDFTATELSSLFKLAEISVQNHSELGHDWVFTLDNKESVGPILVSRKDGWVSSFISIPVAALVGHSGIGPTLRRLTRYIHERYPKSNLRVSSTRDDEHSTHRLVFRISALADIEVLIETIQALFTCLSVMKSPTRKRV
jgi:hypothetical protein